MVLSMMLSDTYNNNLSLSMAKTSTFSDVHWQGAIAPKDYIAAHLAAEVLSLNTGSILKTVVPISHKKMGK